MSLRNEQDTAWKDILHVYLKNCIEYCLPHLSALINWDIPPVFLDKELQAVARGKIGRNVLDKLVKVSLKTGKEQWVLMHVEIQGAKEATFPQRMFTYGYRIWDVHQKPLVSFAILTDANPNWRPSSFETGFAGSRLCGEFLVVKLLDYRLQQQELEASENPFASVILAQLHSMEIKGQSAELRKDTKFFLTKRLYDKGFARKEIDNLYKFIDWLIGLPQELEIDYLEKVHKLEEDYNMPYITFAERFGMEKGREEGIEQGITRGKMEVAKRLLEAAIDSAFVAKITELPLSVIHSLRVQEESI